jgi:tagatose 6-phosphate kinase
VILAAGLTPAWQQLVRLPQLNCGEVNRALDTGWCASGKVLNVARAVHSLGGSVNTLCLVGGTTGDQIRREFEEQTMPAEWVITPTPTRVCTTLLDQQTGQATEIVENSAAVGQTELDEFVARYARLVPQAELVVLSGSLPAGTPTDFYARLLSMTRCPVILDARGPELEACWIHRPWLVKPNREELSQTVRHALANEHAVLQAARECQRRGAQRVVISDGSRALWAVAESAAIVTPATIRVVNPIGCGDCLAAGIAVATVEGQPWIDAVRLGMAAAANNAEQFWPAQLNRERVSELALGIVNPAAALPQ